MPYFQMCGVKMCAGIWVSLWFFTTAPIILNCFDSYCYWLYIRYRMEFNRFLAGTAFSSAIQHSFTVQFWVKRKKYPIYFTVFIAVLFFMYVYVLLFSFLFFSIHCLHLLLQVFFWVWRSKKPIVAFQWKRYELLSQYFCL